MKFRAERMLGRLAKWLRMLGYDTVLEGRPDMGVSLEEEDGPRVILTRRRKKPGPSHAFLLHSDDPMEQLKEVVVTFRLTVDEASLFSRCSVCNRALVAVPKAEVVGRVPDYVLAGHGSFHRCPLCRRVYWPGSHLGRMKKRLAGVLGAEEGPEKENGLT
ncbi:MAG: Mut7-C RNAse domain-containing protein [Deltaproteobacteria bacterium]|nr:Mut7-C RNAse domain-containing protein [Deltaproteobacteria bacterium]